jgi:hypothetical protein
MPGVFGLVRGLTCALFDLANRLCAARSGITNTLRAF